MFGNSIVEVYICAPFFERNVDFGCIKFGLHTTCEVLKSVSCDIKDVKSQRSSVGRATDL